jgi:hypothetical protein
VQAAPAEHAAPEAEGHDPMPAPVTFSELPSEALDRIASLLGHRDIIRLASTNRQFIDAAIGPRVPQASALGHAAAARSASEFDNALARINQLPVTAERPRPMAWLALGATTRPAEHRSRAADLLRDAVAALPQANRHRGLEQVVQSVRYPSPIEAAQAGLHLDAVSLVWRVSMPHGRELLEILAASSPVPGAARDRASSRSDLGALARELGFRTETGRYLLAATSVASEHPGSLGGRAARGEDVQALAARHHITAPALQWTLELAAIHSRHAGSAGQRTLSGEPIARVAQQFGITSPQGIAALEVHASADTTHAGSPGHSAWRGVNIELLAQQHALSTPSGRYALESSAIESGAPGSAGHEIRHGASPADVVQRHGIVMLRSHARLEELHAQAQQAASVPAP